VIFARRRDVPLDRDASARFLPWLIGFMVYLAALALAAALAVADVTARWESGLAGRLTVQVPPAPADAGQAERAARIDQVLAALRGTRGVVAAEQLGPERMSELLAPWLGEDAAKGSELPLPSLIAVTLDPDKPPPLRVLRSALAPTVPGVRVDDHQRTVGRLLEVARSVQLLAGLVLALVGAAAVVTVVFVTRTGLAIHRNVIELLHLIGAYDTYIARQFQRHALRLGLAGGALGLLLALVTLGLLWQALGPMPGGGALLPELRPDWRHAAGLAALPLAAGLVAMLTARWTVLRTLARFS
jgi:cell division transport system permease protein